MPTIWGRVVTTVTAAREAWIRSAHEEEPETTGIVPNWWRFPWPWSLPWLRSGVWLD